jgi:hypothetical protein
VPPPAPTVYKVGDKGPAGGIVFYDKGVVTNGSRYLEAAPHDLGIAQWGAYGKYINAAGDGKRSTAIIIAALEKIGETNKAAQLCAEFESNGFKDWFLPSKEELDLMYINMKKKNLGNFGNDYYWSSSEYGGLFNHYAWSQRFSDGNQTYTDKYDTNSVRAVRAF